jgi:tetratricopeptide (TPR) repeat protein
VGAAISLYYLGRFAACEERLQELEAVAGRAGHHGALWSHEGLLHGIETARTGDIRRQLGYSAEALNGPIFRYVSRTLVGIFGLYLGVVDQALEQFATVGVEQPAAHFFQGMPEANLFTAAALAGQIDRAQALIPTVVPHLPVSGRRNIQGSFFALEAFATGLALIGDREASRGLYPLTLDYIRTGAVPSRLSVGPGNPQLAAALCADAAGMVDQARDHFETALRQARDVPIRILQPTVLYWYGRALSAAPNGAERARGRGMVEAALTDFRALEMVLHAKLAEQFLRDGR